MTHSFKLKADAFFEKVLTFWENLGNARNRNKWIWQPTWQQWNFPLNYSVNLECWVALFISISLLVCFVVLGPQKDVSHKGKRVWLFYALCMCVVGVAERLYQLTWKTESWQTNCKWDDLFRAYFILCVYHLSYTAKEKHWIILYVASFTCKFTEYISAQCNRNI